MATIGLSPFISAIRARQPGQRLRWSSNRSRRLPPSALARYAWKSCRNSAQNPSERLNGVPWVALPAFVILSQTRARAPSSVPESTSSSFISCSARSRRSSDIADLLLETLGARDSGLGSRVPDPESRFTGLALHLGLQPVPDPVEPDGHVVLLQLEHPGQLFDRQPLDVTQQKQAGILAVQGGDAAPKPLLQQKRGLDGGVRRLIVVNRLRMKFPAAQQVDGRVDGCASEVSGRH